MGGLSGLLGGGADVPDYKPYSTTSGVGSTKVVDDQITTTLDPRYQAISEQLTGGLAGYTPGLSAGARELGAGATAGAGMFMQGAMRDPTELGRSQFELMESILSPGRERARTSLEERLLAQGRLGSSGGALTQGALETSIEESRRKSLYDALMQGQQVQQQQAGLFNLFGQYGLGAEQAQEASLFRGLQGALGLEMAPLSYAQLGTSLSGQRSQHQQFQAQMEAQKNQALMGMVGGLASGFMTGGTSFALPALTGGLGLPGMDTSKSAGFDPYSIAY